MNEIAPNGIERGVAMNGQDWRVAWWPPPDPPPGTDHGAAAVCLAGDSIVLISSDGEGPARRVPRTGRKHG
jgi:hypothetical protein